MSTAPVANKEASVMMEKGQVTSGICRTGADENIHMFEAFEHLLLELGPHPGLPFASEQVEGGDNVREIWDEFPVEVGKPSEQLNSLD